MHRVLTLAQHGHIVFADAEYLNGALHRNVRPARHDWKEVTQMSAVRCREGKIYRNLNIRVFPRVMGPDAKKMNHGAWQVYERLTKIPKHEVLAAKVMYEEAWQHFREFIGKDPVVIMEGDRDVYKWNWKLLGQDRDTEIDTIEWILLKPLLKSEHQIYHSKELSSLLNIGDDGTAQDALHNAASMARYCINAHDIYNK